MDIDLSVIIPAYNAEKTIRECLNSVISECESNNIVYEIIVVDDGSTDSTQDVINEIKKENNNIIYIKQNNAGPSAARNNGIKNAKGKFLAFNDADDKWLPGKIELQLKYFTEYPDTDLITAQYENIGKQTTDIPEITYKMMAFHNLCSPQTTIMRNDLKGVFFPENMKYSEDFRFFLMLMEQLKCACLATLVTKSIETRYSFGGTGLSSNLKQMEKGELSNIKYIYKNKKITFVTYICAIVFSYLKYIRRRILQKLKK